MPFSPEDLANDSDSEFGFSVSNMFDLYNMFNHKLDHLTYYEGDGDAWQMFGDYKIYYSEQNITGVKNINLAGNVNVYPNPSTNRVTFNVKGSTDWLTVEFYDI